MTYKEDLQVVNGKIDKLTSKLSGRRNAPLYVSILSLLVALIGLPIMLVAWIEPHLENDQKNTITVEVAKQLATPLQNIGSKNQDIEDLKTNFKALQPFIHDVISHQFENASKLSPQNLGERLPAVRDLLAVARDQKIQVNPRITDTLREKLLQVPSKSPDFWPAAAELINYRSTNLQSVGLRGGGVPNCTDSAPHPPVGETDSEGHMKTLHNGYYENCKFAIDSAKDDERINFLLNNGYVALEFRNCLITYNGGIFSLVLHRSVHDIPIITPGSSGHGATMSYDGPTLQFVDCTFDFSVSNGLPAHGQDLLLALLKEKEPSFFLPLANSAETSPSTHQ